MAEKERLFHEALQTLDYMLSRNTYNDAQLKTLQLARGCFENILNDTRKERG